MNFTTSNVSTNKGKLSKYLSYGNNVFKINNMETKPSKAGDSFKVIFNVETPKVETQGFEPDDTATNGGKVGRVATPIYLKTEEQFKEFVENLSVIADVMGVRPQLDAIQTNDFTDYVNKVSEVLSGKFANWLVTASEYEKQDGKIGIQLHFDRYQFVSKNDDLPKFDKSNKYHYRPVVIPVDTTKDDNPF